ncbi:MAG: hypothetical protein AB1601_16810 [Planctomycetota bacterium]
MLTRTRLRSAGVLAILALVATASAWGSDSIATPPATSAPAAAATTPFWPDLGWPTLCWFGAVAVLALTVRTDRLWTWRNLDGLVLAGMCLLLGLRDSASRPLFLDLTPAAWAALGLSIAAGYWLFRGGTVLLTRGPVQQTGLASPGTRAVLLIVGVALCIQQLAGAPLSPGSRDGLVGGLFTADTGRLPYGDVPAHEGRSPLLYLVYAGANRLVPPTLSLDSVDLPRVAMTWPHRDLWLGQPWEQIADLAPVRLVNAVLLITLVAGVALFAARLGAPDGGATAVALLTIFPGTLECLPRPEIMLPAVLLTWAIVLLTLRGVGALLGVFMLVLAGVAWPWAWLPLPAFLAYCWRRGVWPALSSAVGLVGGAAVVLFGLFQLVQPSIPRADGALAMSDAAPVFRARLADDGTVIVDHREADSSPTRPASYYLWHTLIERDTVTLKQNGHSAATVRIDWPNSVNGRTVLFRQVEPVGDAGPLLQQHYRAVFAQQPPAPRLAAAVRTVLEATWIPDQPALSARTSAWETWAGPSPLPRSWIMLRRGVKLVAALLVVWSALAIFFGRRTQPRHLLGATLLAASGSLLASELGAVTEWVWVLPTLLALWSIHEPAPAPPWVPRGAARPTLPPLGSGPVQAGPPPRITVEPKPAGP